MDGHQHLKHAGQRQTLTEFRSRFWITKGKSYVKHLLNRCVICKRYNTRHYFYPKSPNLSSFRLDKSTPFSACVIDYIGPLYMKDVYNDHQEDEHQLFKSFVLPVKQSVKKTLGNSTVCFNEPQVLLYEIELVLNSRPLGFVYDNDLEEILTLYHLLFGYKLHICNSSIQDNVEINLVLSKRVHCMTMLLNHFW